MDRYHITRSDPKRDVQYWPLDPNRCEGPLTNLEMNGIYTDDPTSFSAGLSGTCGEIGLNQVEPWKRKRKQKLPKKKT